MTAFILTALISYLAGSIPTAYIIMKIATGVDIRTVGSGNVGATNVFRNAGRTAGITTYVLDVLKGWVSTAVVAKLFAANPEQLQWLIITGFSCAVIGHNWPVFLGFKGGKGVAVSSGGLLGINQFMFACVFGVWFLVFRASNYVSLASITAAAVLPVFMFIFERSWPLTVFALILGALVILKHKSNIERLITGTETKTKFK